MKEDEIIDEMYAILTTIVNETRYLGNKHIQLKKELKNIKDSFKNLESHSHNNK